jgi:isopentenyl-diphosphate delta-isomerase|tara:strand:- start:894 stop:1394 length:501 start_codon:yes stop_codon:yes gene_type:complete
MTSYQEILDVVDLQDNIISKAPRDYVHNNLLMHRSSHVLLFNFRDELFLQKRSLNKDECPGLWDASAAGHVESGEDYLHCAHRELEEELGVTHIILNKIMCLPAQEKTFLEHIYVYKCITGSEITINKDEISEGRFWDLPLINQSIHKNATIFTPTFKIIFKNLIK